MIKYLIRLILKIVLIVCSVIAIAGNPEIDVTKINENIIILNKHLIALSTEKGIIIINTLFPEETAKMKNEIERIIKRNDYYCLINSNANPDFTGGNSIFKNITIVGHDNFESEMNNSLSERKKLSANRLEDFKRQLNNETYPEKLKDLNKNIKETQNWITELNKIKIIPPSITFNSRLTLNCGNITLCLLYYGKGPANKSHIIIYVPEQGVLFTGGGYAFDFHIPHKIYIGEENNLELRIKILSELLQNMNKLDYAILSYYPFQPREKIEEVLYYYKTLYYGISDSVSRGYSMGKIEQQFSIDNKFSNLSQLEEGDRFNQIHNENIKTIWNYFKNEKK